MPKKLVTKKKARAKSPIKILIKDPELLHRGDVVVLYGGRGQRFTLGVPRKNYWEARGARGGEYRLMFEPERELQAVDSAIRIPWFDVRE